MFSLRNRLRSKIEGEKRERGLGFGIIDSILPQTGLLPKTNPGNIQKEIGDEKLITAERLLREYAGEVGCSWCSRKALETANLVKNLREVTPIAAEMAKRVGPLEQSKMAELREELEKAKEELKKAG